MQLYCDASLGLRLAQAPSLSGVWWGSLVRGGVWCAFSLHFWGCVRAQHQRLTAESNTVPPSSSTRIWISRGIVTVGGATGVHGSNILPVCRRSELIRPVVSLMLGWHAAPFFRHPSCAAMSMGWSCPSRTILSSVLAKLISITILPPVVAVELSR